MNDNSFLHFEAIAIDKVNFPFFQNIQCDILRLDKIHPIISGNKYFKLKYHVVDFYKKPYAGMIFFGGGYSNLIIAAASYCKEKGISCVGIIRGKYESPLPYTLVMAEDLGMQLIFLSKEEYTHRFSIAYQDFLHLQYPNYYIVADGGFGEYGAKGMEEIMQQKVSQSYDYWVGAIGTGTMLAGMINAAPPTTKIIGINCLKHTHIHQEIDLLLKQPKDYHICLDYHFGGFAKHKQSLIDFMNLFYKNTQIPLDFVYSGKTAFAINDLIQKNYFPQGSRILMVHCGGLQGNYSLAKGTLIF